MNIETVSTPTHAELVEEFKLISRATYKGIRGVWCLESGHKGPTVGITIHTHGNEPSGLVAFHHIRQKFRLWKRLCCGRVFFVLNNILATKKYLEAPIKSKKLDARFVNTDMNRLPDNLSRLVRDPRYEIRRARELLPVWREFDAAMDIHSTTKQSPPMIIRVGESEEVEKLTRNFRIKTVIADIAEHQLGNPAVDFYGNPRERIPTVGIETGSHENKKSFAVAVECVKRFLEAAGVIENNVVRSRAVSRRTYFVGGSVVFPDESWELAKVFQTFEQVRKGQILAIGSGGQTIRSPFTGVTLFGPSQRKPEKHEYEVLFLARSHDS